MRYSGISILGQLDMVNTIKGLSIVNEAHMTILWHFQLPSMHDVFSSTEFSVASSNIWPAFFYVEHSSVFDDEIWLQTIFQHP